jgi:NDP-sugar pyrophosphorylase family protein
MKALLICPTGRPAVSLLCESGPLATTPILGDCLVGYWIEHLAALGARQIQVIATEGAGDVRNAVGDGARWGVRINVTESNFEPTPQEAASQYRPAGEEGWLPAPNDIVSMSHLPGCPGLPLFRSYANWFAALAAWVPMARTPARVRITQLRPGIWVGSRAQVSALAELIAPCWIGDRATVSAGAVVGPGAILEDRSVADSTARISQSWVGPDTLVGPMTSVVNSLAWGSTLIDWRSDSLLHVPDPFLLSSLARPKSPATTDQFGRALAHKIPLERNLASIMALDASIGKSSDLKLPA